MNLFQFQRAPAAAPARCKPGNKTGVDCLGRLGSARSNLFGEASSFMLDLKQAFNALACHLRARPGKRSDVLFAKTNLHIVLRRLFPWALVCLYGAICLLRAPQVFAGRFWAEEGIYYGLFQTLSVASSLFYAGAGYPVILTNASVLLSELVPVEYAPVITTVVGLGALLALLALILLWSERLGLDNAMAGIIAALVMMLPHTAEVTANATNLQWIAAAIGVLVLLLPGDASKGFSCCVVFIAGLAGPATILLIPAFILKCGLDRSRSSWMQLGCLLLPVAVMTIVMLGANQSSTRSHPLDPDLYLSVVSTQSAMTVFFGFDASLAVTSWYRAAPGAVVALLAKIISSAAVAVPFGIGLAFRETRRASILLATAYWVSAFVGTFGAIGPYNLINPLSRYFFAPNVILLLSLGILGSRLAPLTGTALLSGILAIHSLPNKIPTLVFDGPSWRAQIPDGGIQKPTQVNIWPAEWTVTLLPRSFGMPNEASPQTDEVYGRFRRY
jgi:hypothetical protein